uniref:Uncharacterized protein n=1 Tax=Ciona intestinalis TaxID=7719 RepID=H2XQQ9_CIOIN
MLHHNHEQEINDKFEPPLIMSSLGVQTQQEVVVILLLSAFALIFMKLFS